MRLKGIVDGSQEITRKFNFTLNQPPTGIFASHNSVSDVHPVNTPVAYFSANDPNSNDRINYELVTDSLLSAQDYSFAESTILHNSLFRLDGHTLTLLDPLSESGLDEYVVRVKASDQGGLSVTRDFRFDVIPSPGKIFLSNDDFNESDSESTFVGIILTDSVRVDQDVLFSFVDGNGSSDNDLFHISGNQLILNSAADFETKSLYSVRIAALFSDGVVLEESFELSVDDVNEAPSSVLASVSSFDECVDELYVVAQLSATDPDADDAIEFLFSIPCTCQR